MYYEDSADTQIDVTGVLTGRLNVGAGKALVRLHGVPIPNGVSSSSGDVLLFLLLVNDSWVRTAPFSYGGPHAYKGALRAACVTRAVHASERRAHGGGRRWRGRSCRSSASQAAQANASRFWRVRACAQQTPALR